MPRMEELMKKDLEGKPVLLFMRMILRLQKMVARKDMNYEQKGYSPSSELVGIPSL